MANLTDLQEWKDACVKYKHDIKQFALDIGMELTQGQYVLLGDITEVGSRNHIQFDSETIKIEMAVATALWHLFFSPHSMTLFTAKNIQFLKQIIWTDIQLWLDTMRKGSLAWLVDWVVISRDCISIKGNKHTWKIYTKSVPSTRPEAMAGTLAENYLIWIDQVSDFDESVLDILKASLVNKKNRAVITSLVETKRFIRMARHLSN